jgi:hypothetical protein
VDHAVAPPESVRGVNRGSLGAKAEAPYNFLVDADPEHARMRFARPLIAAS